MLCYFLYMSLDWALRLWVKHNTGHVTCKYGDSLYILVSKLAEIRSPAAQGYQNRVFCP
jgi:hypothetical protein